MAAIEKKSKTKGKNEEIDLIALAKTLWVGRGIVIKTVMFFFIIGVFIAIFSKKEYTATTTMVPQINNPSAKMGGLSSLASLAGFNLNMSSDAFDISPILYPKIINSTSFQLEIMNAEYYFDELKEPESLYNYYTNIYNPGVFEIIKKYTVGLPALILKSIRKKKTDSAQIRNTNTIKLTEEQNEIRKTIDKRLKIEVNDKEGYLILFSKFHQSSLSAQVAQKAQKLLQECITNFRIEKATAEFEFIKERYNEKKQEFETSQEKLAYFRDENRNITSAFLRTEEERLENEYQLAFEVYSELANQLEKAKIKIKEDTPAFSIIEEVVVPLERSKPQRVMILILWIILGLIVGIGLIGSKIFLSSLRNQWQINMHEENN